MDSRAALLAKFAQQVGYAEDALGFLKHAEKATQSFRQRYWYAEGGYLYDVIDGPSGNDASLRPNQLFALSLEPDLLTPEAARSVIDVCAKQLLTSYGMRSLAPTHEDYQGIFTGDRYARDGAYHQGTVWSWLIGPFAEAHYHVYHDRATAVSYLRPFEQHLHDLCVGSISEVFYGAAPHLPRGCAAQAWSVAEVLRMWVDSYLNASLRLFAFHLRWPSILQTDIASDLDSFCPKKGLSGVWKHRMAGRSFT